MKPSTSRRNVRLELTEIERGVLREILKVPPPGIDRALRAAPASESISLSLDDLKQLGRCVSFAADRTRKQTMQSVLDFLSAKIERLIRSREGSPQKRTSRAEAKMES
jgi:hypothetical protein